MHKPPLAPIVFASLFPNPKSTDPQNFQQHISKQLVPEVRAETARFYGHIDCAEAQYPGLDYATAAHRLRLHRFPHHRRLFQVFDHLRLTNYEIQTLCKWEGTRWARERYEKDIGHKLLETTWDDVVLAIPESPTVTRIPLQQRTPLAREKHRFECISSSVEAVTHSSSQVGQVERLEELSAMGEQGELRGGSHEDLEVSQDNEDEIQQEQEQDESEDELQASYGVELNQRLMVATEARNRGEEVVLDPDWEQWLKEASERGPVPNVSNTSQVFADHPATWTPRLPGAFQTDQSALSTPLSIPGTVNPALDGSSAPPTGTAM
ncbi:MAG: hypothetical protein Q9174_000518 [Haloplaca sp. 1 TL-2023]